MGVFAIGEVAAGVMLVDSVASLPRAADIAAEQTAGTRQAVEVPAAVLDAAGGAFGLYGRSLELGPPVALVAAATGKAARRAEWMGRIGRAYVDGMRQVERWWPDGYQNETTRWRAYDVIAYEIPSWWRCNAVILAHAAAGRAWPTMTEAQVEAVVAHYEGLLNIDLPASGDFPAVRGIMPRWYQVGVALGSTRRQVKVTEYFPNAPGPTRMVSEYADWTTTLSAALYTDTFRNDTAARIVPRTPDYTWTRVNGGIAQPDGFDPENPA